MTQTTISLLDHLLSLVCEKLQLPPSLYEEAEKHYKAVGEWLAAQGSILAVWRPTIYPHGSMRIGTTNRPIGREEYDLDLVCELLVDYRYASPGAILKKVEQRLRDNKIYAPMLELKKRCVRLTYAKQFHLDILPAVPEVPMQETKVRVPDRELKEWKASDPKGYAVCFERRSGQYSPALEAKAEPLPEPEDADEKTPLQKSVQLIKRWRDIAFKDDPDSAPRSIVLTTLAANAYQGESSVVNALDAILQRILDSIRVQPSRPLVVRNPSNAEEVLSEKWEENPEFYWLFVHRLSQFDEMWKRAREASGLDATKKILAELFGEDVATSAVTAYAEAIGNARQSGVLRIVRSTGALTTAALAGTTSVKANTFYGED